MTQPSGAQPESNPEAADRVPSGGWNSDWSGLRVAVLGLGSSGFAAADTLVELGAIVRVFSAGHDHRREELLAVIGAELSSRTLDDEAVAEFAEFSPDLVIVSPGFSPSHQLVQWTRSASIPLWGDVELAWRLRDKVDADTRWLVASGANAAQTVELAERFLLRAGLRVLACGNHGVPVLDAVRDPVGWDVLVVEMSSPQLSYAPSVSPWASICVGVEDEFVDWHGSAQALEAALASTYEWTRFACVYDKGDAAVLGMVEEAEVVEGCRAIGVDRGVPGPSDLGVVDGILCDRAFHDDRRSSALEIVTVAELETVGIVTADHVSRVLEAAALARSVDVPVAVIRDELLGR